MCAVRQTGTIGSPTLPHSMCAHMRAHEPRQCQRNRNEGAARWPTPTWSLEPVILLSLRAVRTRPGEDVAGFSLWHWSAALRYFLADAEAIAAVRKSAWHTRCVSACMAVGLPPYTTQLAYQQQPCQRSAAAGASGIRAKAGSSAACIHRMRYSACSQLRRGSTEWTLEGVLLVPYSQAPRPAGGAPAAAVCGGAGPCASLGA